MCSRWLAIRPITPKLTHVRLYCTILAHCSRITFLDCLDSILDYPGWFSLKSAFSNPAGNLSALVDTVTKTQTIYKNGAFMTGSFLENHDQPRFQSLTQDQAVSISPSVHISLLKWSDQLVKNAMMWPFINDGIPILYYGQFSRR